MFSLIRVFFVLIVLSIVLITIYASEPDSMFINGNTRAPGFAADDPSASLFSLYILVPIMTIIIYILFLL